MRDRYHTIILVPHSRAKLRKWQVTPRQLRLALAAAAVVTLGAGIACWFALASAVDQSEVARLKRENQALRQLNQTFEGGLEKLQKQLSTYEDRTRKLAIVAGIETEGTPPSAGIGGALAGSQDPVEAHLQSLEARSLEVGENLIQLENRFEERSRIVSSTPTIAPVKGIYTSGFGLRRDPVNGRPEFHPGLDIAAPAGYPVRASADGVVLRAGLNGGLGRSAALSHGFGYGTVYGHMSRLAVQPGQRIHRGDVLGYVGNTGHATGYHLHYEVHVDGKAVDPVRFILEHPEP